MLMVIIRFINWYMLRGKCVRVLKNIFLSILLLSVLRGHSFFSSSRQRPMTSDFKGFLYQILSITLFSYLNYWERASIPLFNAKQGNYWYHFFNVFGMTRSLSGDWTRDLPHSKPIEPFHIHPIHAVCFL